MVGLCLVASIAAGKKFQTKTLILVGVQPFGLPCRVNQASACLVYVFLGLSDL
jgi:hypothetical protein